MTPDQPRHPLALLAERVNSEHTRTLAEVARFAHGLEPDQHTELIRIVQAGIQRRDESAKTLRAQAETEARPQVVYAECADYRDGDVTLVGRVFPDGVRLGCQALEPWYATGVLIPPIHPAYMPAQQLLAALAQAQAGAGEGQGEGEGA